MSLKPQAICPVPPETVRVARAAYPKGNLYLRLRDHLGRIFRDEDFADLYPKEGQPAEAPWRLALVSVMQFLEGLSDRQAANAVRGRLDWKYLLGLDLTDPGFDPSVLVEFRQRLLAGGEELRIFDLLPARLRDGGYVKARGRQRSDSTHVLAKIRSLNRVEVVGETFRATLNVLAVAAPEWLGEQMQEGWVERYEHRVEDYRLPDGKQAREAYALVIGQDGSTLLTAIYASLTPAWLRDLPAVQTLRRVWVQHFFWEEGELRWREIANMPIAGDCINSPYDPEAKVMPKSARQAGWGTRSISPKRAMMSFLISLPMSRRHLHLSPILLLSHPSTKRLRVSISYPKGIWLIPGMWMPQPSSTAIKPMRLISLVRAGMITIGKPARRPDLPPNSLRWIGNKNGLFARRARPVAVGRQPRIGEATR
jgi:transposase